MIFNGVLFGFQGCGKGMGFAKHVAWMTMMRVIGDKYAVPGALKYEQPPLLEHSTEEGTVYEPVEYRS